MTRSRIRSSLLPAVLAAALSACGGESTASPVPPSTSEPSEPVAADSEPPPRASTGTPEIPGASDSSVREAIRAVFERESGAIEAVYLVTRGDIAVTVHEELRWSGDSGSQGRRSSFEGVPDGPAAQAIVDRGAELDSEVVYSGAELTAVLEGRRDEMLAHAAAATEDGDGWWRGLVPGGGGMASFGLHLSDGVADRMEYVQVGWDTTVRVDWTVSG